MTKPPGAPISINYSVVPAVVTNNEDRLGRVRVRFPWMDDRDESDWIAIAGPGAGADRGLFCVPAQNDQVLVAFSFGHIDKAYVIGSLWSAADRPPSDGDRNKRTWRSASGHTITLDDTSGAEQVAIVDRSGGSKITIDTSGKTLTIESRGDLTIKAVGNLTLQAGAEVKLTGSTVALEASSGLAAKASQIAINGPAGVNINDGALEVV